MTTDLSSVDMTLAHDILNGLKASPKFMSSKYFYDDKGSELFQAIMRMPEYYPTDCEFEIFQTYQEELLAASQKAANGNSFRLVEFGAGDGFKTKVLLEHFLTGQADFTYTPIDISGGALRNLQADLTAQWPDLHVKPFEADYFEALHTLNETSDECKLVLFLGSNLGNFTLPQAQEFLKAINENLHPGDLLLLGLDLKKDPHVILPAYDDAQGITRAFNLNLLHRLNRELGANFEVAQFMHAPMYDPLTGECRSYLVSKRNQTVHFAALNQSIEFRAWEAIWTELSQKYDLDMVAKLARSTGFKVVRNFSDERGYFLDTLWQKQ